MFDALFSEEEHERLLKSGDVRLSYKAMQGALMIFLYRCAHSITTVPAYSKYVFLSVAEKGYKNSLILLQGVSCGFS